MDDAELIFVAIAAVGLIALTVATGILMATPLAAG